MQRIFLTLATLSTIVTAVAFGLGLTIGDPTVRDAAVQRTVSYHMLAGMGSLIFTTLVHAIVLTYFMGTGRWLEETTQAYKLSGEFFRESRQLKYRTILLQTACLLFIIVTGAFGAAADPASAVGFQGWGGLTAGMVHQLFALSTWALNLCVHLWQYFVLTRNGQVIDSVLAEVRRIRLEHGLSV